MPTGIPVKRAELPPTHPLQETHYVLVDDGETKYVVGMDKNVTDLILTEMKDEVEHGGIELAIFRQDDYPGALTFCHESLLELWVKIIIWNHQPTN